MFLEIFACLLIALGIFGIYNLIDSRKGDKETLKVLIISLILTFFGIYLLIRGVDVYLLIKKIIGIFLIVFGSFMTFYFPGTGYTHRGFKNTGIFFGLFLIVFGIYLLLF